MSSDVSWFGSKLLEKGGRENALIPSIPFHSTSQRGNLEFTREREKLQSEAHRQDSSIV
jgi:hypothetical protein